VILTASTGITKTSFNWNVKRDRGQGTGEVESKK
jgi:hypothetical protein